MSPLLVTIKEAAETLSVSRSTIYRLIDSGRLLAVRVASAPRIPAAALERFVEQAIRDARTGGNR